MNDKHSDYAMDLHDSVRNESEQRVGLLLEGGHQVQVDAVDERGRTSLHLAVERWDNGCKIVRILLEHGADTEIRDKTGRTPLHLAAKNGSVRNVKVLLEFGAEVDSKDYSGKTALHLASEERHEHVVKELLDYSADFNAHDEVGKTPIEHVFNAMDSFFSGHDYDYDPYYNSGTYFESFNNVSTYYYSESDISAFKKVFLTLAMHVDKAIASGAIVSKNNLKLVNSGQQLGFFPDGYARENFRRGCLNEIEKMKCEEICDRVFYYDMLTKDKERLELYARNENVSRILETDEYKNKFPIYASILEKRVAMGSLRNTLLNSGIKSIVFLLQFALPHLVIREIFKYLSTKDLRNLVIAREKLRKS